MQLERKVALLRSADQNQAYQALKELLAESRQSERVYPYFDQFVQMMRDANSSYVRTRGMRLIAANARWDTKKRIEGIIGEYLVHMEDEKPTVARQCIRDAALIARYKPELSEIILEALKTTNKQYKDSMQSLVDQDREEAIWQISQRKQ